MTPPTPPALEVYDQAVAYRAGTPPFDASFKTIFDDLSEGVLVIDSGGHRVYANPALDDLVTGNACLPVGGLEPPWYVPGDQRQRYLAALQGTSSLLTLDGAGTASTWLDLAVPGRPRFRARVTISAFSGPRGRFAVWLFKPEGGQATWSREAVGPYGAGTRETVVGSLPVPGVGTLTKREGEVLQLLLDGLRVSSIAHRLYLSPQTVRNHLKAIFRKLGAHSQAELLDSLRPPRQAPPRQAPPRLASERHGPSARAVLS